jgi:hypothetical protein
MRLMFPWRFASTFAAIELWVTRIGYHILLMSTSSMSSMVLMTFAAAW